jgi:membrane-bound lytic murein transglycosylase MltF
VLRKYLKNTKFVKSATSEAELKKFRGLVDTFKKYGGQYKVDPVLALAQGYQESQLDQNAKSGVGAIGIMQVMPATGKELNVGDIKQAEANIHAGVKYIRFMIDQYFAGEPLTDLNKMLFAFAAYNCGPARLRQLRRETARRGLDGNIWFNNVERVAGERIGRETVQYVSNIYKYYVAYTLTLEDWHP